MRTTTHPRLLKTGGMKTESNVMPSVVEIFAQGYSADMTRTIIDSIDAYAYAMATRGDAPGEKDSDNIYNLTWLLRAILVDSFNIPVG